MPTTPTRKTGPRPKPVQLTDSDIFQRVDELYRAIRGYDGVPGMAADVISLKESYRNLSEKLLPSLKQELIDVMCAKLELKDQPNVKWPDLLKGLFYPLIVAITSSAVTALVLHRLTNLP